MKLLSVVRDERTNTVEATWTDDNGKRVRCHIYSDRQMADLRADLGKDGAEYEDLITLVEATIKPIPEATPEQLKAEAISSESKELREDVKFRNLLDKTPAQTKTWVENNFPSLTLAEQRDLATIVLVISALGKRL